LADFSLKSSSYQGRYLILECSQRIDIDSYSSIIDWTLSSVGGSSSYYSIAPTTVTIDGNTVYSKGHTSWSDKVFPASTGSVSGSLTIHHDDSGSKSIEVCLSTSVYTDTPNDYSDTWNLNSIAKVSVPTLSKDEVCFGENITIYSNRTSNNFTHHLYYCMNGGDWKWIGGFSDSYDWNIPKSLMNEIPGSNYGYITFLVHTFSGGINIGSNTVSISVGVPDNIVPIIDTISCKDTLQYQNGYFIQNKSKILISVNASSAYSSSIVSYKIEANGGIYNYNNATTSEIINAGVNTIKVTVTDSRGKSSTQEKTITVIPYTNPYKNVLSANRCTSEGIDDDKGEYAKINIKAYISSIENTNEKQFVLYCKKITDTVWTKYYEYSDSYSFEDNIILNLDPESTYNIKLVCNDYFSSIPFETILNSVFSLIELKKNGKGISFGKTAEYDIFDVNLDARFRKDLICKTVKTENGGDLDNITGYGNNENGSYYKFSDGSLICTKLIPYDTSANIQWGTLYETSEINLGNYAHPFINKPTVSISVDVDEGACFTEGILKPTETYFGKTCLCRPTESNVKGVLHLKAIGRYK
jgi:hypothetical protein